MLYRGNQIPLMKVQHPLPPACAHRAAARRAVKAKPLSFTSSCRRCCRNPICRPCNALSPCFSSPIVCACPCACSRLARALDLALAFALALANAGALLLSLLLLLLSPPPTGCSNAPQHPLRTTSLSPHPSPRNIYALSLLCLLLHWRLPWHMLLYLLQRMRLRSAVALVVVVAAAHTSSTSLVIIHLLPSHLFHNPLLPAFHCPSLPPLSFAFLCSCACSCISTLSPFFPLRLTPSHFAAGRRRRCISFSFSRVLSPSLFSPPLIPPPTFALCLFFFEMKSNIARRTMHIGYCTLHSAHCASHVAHYTLHIAHWFAHRTQLIAHCTLLSAQRTTHNAHRTIHVAHCTSHIAHRTLHISYAHCTL